MKHAPALLLIALLAAPASAHPGPRLAEWLAALPDARLARAAPELLVWRRKHTDLLARLTRFARDASHPRALRAGALQVLAALAEQPGQVPELSGDLAPLVKRARERTSLRAEARKHLAAVAGAPERVAAVAKAISPACGAELLDLALDPLLPTSQRPLILRLIAWRGGAELDTAIPLLIASSSLEPAQVLGPILGVLEQRGELIATARRLFQSATAPSGAKAKLARWLGERKVTGAANAIRWLEQRPELTRADRADIQVALLLLDPRAAATHLPRLVEHALAADDSVADAAIRGLARIRPAGLGPHLAQAFKVRDPGGARRVRAMQVAEVLGVSDFVDQLGRVVLDGAQPISVRQAAAHALGTLARKKELRPLMTTLRGSRTDRAALRRETADAIARAAAREPLPGFLLGALESALPREPEPTVRAAILRAMATVASPSSRTAIQRLLARVPRLGAREARQVLVTATRLGMFDRAAAQQLIALRARDPRSASLGLAVVTYAANLRAGLAVPALLPILRDREPSVARAALRDLIRRWPAARRKPDERTPPAKGSVPAAVRARWAARWSKEPQTFR